MDCQPPPNNSSVSRNNNSRLGPLHWGPKSGRQPNAFVYGGQASAARKCIKSNDKRSRTSFSQHQLRLLEEAFRQTNYPNQVYRDQLAANIELEPARVQIWFQNRRAKLKKQLAGKAGCRHHVGPASLIDHQQLQIQAQTSTNLIDQQQLYLANGGAETALDLHLSSHNTSSQSSRSSSSDDPYQNPPVTCAYSGELISPAPKGPANFGFGHHQSAEVAEQGFYYGSEAYAGPTAAGGEQQGQVYEQQQQQTNKMLHQLYLPQQAQLFSLQQSQQHEHQHQQQQDEVSEFSRMLNSELGRALYCATTTTANQQRQQPHRQVFYQQQQAHHPGLEQTHSDQYVRY